MGKLAKYLTIILMFATSCGVIQVEDSANKSYALAILDYDVGPRVLLVSVNDDGKTIDLSERFPELSPNVSWSPDGNEFAFSSNREDNWEIFSVGLETQSVVNLTQNYADDGPFAWSPNGELIAFLSTREYCPDETTTQDCWWSKRDLYIMKRDGSEVQRIADFGVNHCGVAWWPDNKKLIYSVSCNFVDDNPTEIYIVDIEDGKPVQLTDSSSVSVTLPYAYNSAPQPSPDGLQILFYSFRDNDRELYLMAPDGSEQVRLTDIPGPESSASWSPDGSFIAWEHDQEILVMNVETREIANTETKILSACRPYWSPSGEQIAFIANCGFGDAGPHDTVYLMDRNGSNKVNLTDHLGQRRFGLIGWVPIEWMDADVSLE